MFHSGYRLKRPFLHSVISLLLLLTLAACNGSQSQQSTPTQSPSAQLSTIDLGIPQKALHSLTTGNLPDNTQLHVLVTFKVNQALLKQLGTSQKNESGQGSDLTTMANQLGITDQQYQQVKQFFGVQDVSIQLNSLHTILTLDAPASTFAKLLKTSFVYHEYQGRTFFAPAAPLMLPQAIAQYIQAINGLDSYTRPLHAATSMDSLHSLNTGAQKAGCLVTDANGGFTIQQIRQAYGFNQAIPTSAGGGKTTILLPEFAAFSQSDLQFYLNCVQFHGKISVVTVNNNPPTNEDVEPLLDLEMVAGLLPNANIVVYQEANSGYAMQDVFNQIETDYAKNHSPVDLSISWGLAENLDTQDDISALNTAIQTMVLGEHINFFGASGDCAAYDDSTNYPDTLAINYPASDPYSISVGGTELSASRAGSRTKEVVWTGSPQQNPNCDNTWGSGGGLSQTFRQPSWQQGPGVRNSFSNGQRQAPDVSAIANNIVIFAQGQWDYSGGTSAATPIWASAIALANEGLMAKTHYYTYGPALFYWMDQHAANAHPYYDVTQGNNLHYPATPGWDFATGLGTPNVPGLLQGLQTFIAAQR
ncbi:MAG: S53 family peptidase [Ktedonobacteraceae bacterium]